MRTYSYIIPIILSATLLVGCPQAEKPKTPSEKLVEQQPKIIKKEAELNDAMVAELLLKNRDYVAASNKYLEIAEKLNDKDAARRATLIAFRSGDPKLTLKAGAAWAKIAPEDMQAQLLVSILLLNSNQPQLAETYLNNILQAKIPIAKNAMLTLIKSLAKPAARNALRDNLETLSRRAPENPQVYFYLAYLDMQAKNMADAEKNVKLALQYDPKWEDAIALQAWIMDNTGKSDDATRYLQEKLNAMPQASLVRFHYARLLAKQGQFNEAKQQFDLLLKIPNTHGSALLELARIAYEEKNIDLSKKYLTQATDDPTQANTARMLLGKIAFSERHYGEAIAWYKAVTSGPLYVSARINMAILTAEQGEYDEALTIIKETPVNNYQALKLKEIVQIQILRLAKRLPDAERMINNNLKVFPKDPVFIYLKSSVQLEQGNVNDAISSLHQVIALQPNNIAALNTLGFILTDYSKRYDEALPHLQKALNLAPKNPDVLDSMGWLQYRLGNTSQALDYLQAAFKLKPRADTAAHLGEVLWHDGQKNQAKLVWTSGLKLDPENPKLLKTIKAFDASLLAKPN